IARHEARRDPRRGGSAMAVAGIVCSFVGAALAIGFSVYIINKVGHCVNYPAGSYQYNQCIRNSI
ncbi:MAG: DUF4190 domain-containing protein, partial [Mycobacteriales bacterium]